MLDFPFSSLMFRRIFVLFVLLSSLAFAESSHAQKGKATPQPDKGNDPGMWVGSPPSGALPAGVTHHTYTSGSMKCEVGYCLYLPPGYTSNSERRYPVIYNLHGAGGDEYRTLYNAEVLDEGIRAGRWPDMIMVFPNGGRATMYQNSGDGRYLAETTFIEELVPHIDSTCRTIADRKGRCLEGFSMGGRGSTHLAMKHPDMFCSLFNQAGNVYSAVEMAKTVGPEEWPVSYLGSDPAHLLSNDVYANLNENLDYIKAKLRIQVACGTADPGHLKSVREYHEALVEAGVEHTYWEVEGLDHNQRKMIEGRKDTWFDFHIESLRLAGAEW